MSTRKNRTPHIRPSPTFVRFLQLTLGRWIRRKLRMTYINRKIPNNEKPPYLIIPNHVGFWDPFLVGPAVPHPIHFVVADANFRSPILRFLLGSIGSIPITKSMSDTDAVRLMMDVRRDGGIICLFAEGRRTWDGRTLPIVSSTAKLIKLLKIPVLVPILEGAFFSNPCWGAAVRPGRMNIRFQRLFDGSELRTLRVEEIHRRLETALQHNDYDWQKKNMVRFKSRRSAEHLDLVLHTCQSCKGIGTLESKGQLVYCNGCGHTTRFTEYGFFEGVSGPTRFATVPEWNDWQTKLLEERISTLLRKPSASHTAGSSTQRTGAVFRDTNVRLYIGSRRRPLQKLVSGTLTMYTDRIEFRPESGGVSAEFIQRSFPDMPVERIGHTFELSFPLHELGGFGVHNHERLEWYYRRRLYHFRKAGNRLSGYKWYRAFHIALAGEAAGEVMQAHG